MTERIDEAWVLSTRDLGESDRLVTFFTSGEGTVRGVARHARKSRRRFGGTLEPLTRVSVRWQARGRDLERIDSCESLETFHDILATPETQAMGALFSEILEAVVSVGQPEPELFRLTGATLRAVGAGLDPWLARRYFEYWTLRLLGLWQDGASCGHCGVESGPQTLIEPDGEPVCADCATDSACRMEVEVASLLTSFATRSPDALIGASIPVASGTLMDRRIGGAIRNMLERPLRTDRFFRAACRSRNPGVRG